jgi:hypothetical protein
MACCKTGPALDILGLWLSPSGSRIGTSRSVADAVKRQGEARLPFALQRGRG